MLLKNETCGASVRKSECMPAKDTIAAAGANAPAAAATRSHVSRSTPYGILGDMSRPASQPEPPPASAARVTAASPRRSPRRRRRSKRWSTACGASKARCAACSAWSPAARPAKTILTQLSATRAALDRVGIFLITHKIRECLLDEGDTSSEAAVQRALETFQKYAQHLQMPPGDDGP